MVKSRKEGKDCLILRIETEADPNNFAQLKEALNNKFMNDRPSFNEFVKKNSIWPLQIDLLPPATLERNSRTGKLIRLKDVL